MCCCGTPTINGTDATYRWQPNDAPSIRPADPPALSEGDHLLIDAPGRCGGTDAPGRCGGTDSHCHHYRMVQRGGMAVLLVRNGGGDSFINHVNDMAVKALARLNANDGYWLMNAIYHAYGDGQRHGSEKMDRKWREAASEKRIKVRRERTFQSTTVTITPRNPDI